MGLIYLALDTATDRPTLALGTPQSPGADVAVPHRRDLSREIDRMVQGLLAVRGAQLRTLSGIVVADGPGSFTGLRIGVAFAKGVCRALGLSLLSAPSLLGAARASCPGAGTVVAEYDALRGDSYRAVYRFTSRESGSWEIETLLAPQLVRAGAELSAAGPILRAGAHAASAGALLRLVGVPGGASEVRDPSSWEPAYGRPAEAEARLLARRDRLPST